GSRDDVAALLREMDVFALSSRREGISNTVLEAMASGVPVVASATGGNLELIEDGRTGTLVPGVHVQSESIHCGACWRTTRVCIAPSAMPSRRLPDVWHHRNSRSEGRAADPGRRAARHERHHRTSRPGRRRLSLRAWRRAR